MVDIFRGSEAAGHLVDDIIRLNKDLTESSKIKVAWMQLTVRNDAAAERAKAAGISVVMDRCPKIEYGRQGGELGWSGANTKIIDSRIRGRVRPGSLDRVPTEDDVAPDYGFFTRAVHAGAAPDPITGARVTPIFQNTSYVFKSVDHAASLFNLHEYGFI